MKPSKSYDLTILGGGIAGMTAAIFAARANLSTLIVEEHACGGLANWTNTVENFPSHISINGMELMERVQEQVRHLGVAIDEAAEIERLDLAGPVKTVETAEWLYNSRAVILATGREPIRLRLESDSERIHYCSVCDGSAYKGKKVLVVGGGNSGFDESLYLMSLGVSGILMVEFLDSCCAAETTQARLRRHGGVEIRCFTQVTAIAKEGQGCRVTLLDRASGETSSVWVDGVFVFIGQKANTQALRGIVELDPQGYILAGPNRETNLAGVYAAGDVVQKDYRYLTTAMADGTIAALAAEKYLRSLGEDPC